MEVLRHSKRDAVRFDQEWRAILMKRHFQRRRFGDSDLQTWQDGAALGLSFAHDRDSTSGTISFQEGEQAPHPSELCEFLQLESVWFFGPAYSWAVHTGHEDRELAELFERLPDDADS